MSIILTGGAGFIGSCFLKTLNLNGITDVIVVDNLNDNDKILNLKNKNYSNYYDKNDFLWRLNGLDNVSAVVHLGACSSTTQTDLEYLRKNNVEYSIALFNYCQSKKIPLIYASSAATYGMGENGFSDLILPCNLKPLNAYGESKNAFDNYVLNVKEKTAQVVGLKFFNVYGPNENHKKGMYSMVFQGFNQVKDNNEIKLFESTCDNILNGEQKRDFVYVKDVCDVILWFLNNKVSGIYNVGTGVANSFNSLATHVFNAMQKEVNIKYINMPLKLKAQYQNYTVADTSSLKKVGYNKQFTSLKDGVYDYVLNYLIKNERY